MKKIIISSLLVLFCLQALSAQYRTERTGFEGDFFSLEGALELFQNAPSLRSFERQLNTRNSWVNNLDLDLDGRTDYIRVEHRRQGDFHLVILQAIVGRYDIQDVAVIQIERIGRRDAILQIVGDEDLYGQEVFVEPLVGYANSRTGYQEQYGEYVNVFYWPIVQFMFGPQYTQAYISPYRWQYYPTWWTTWRPVTWNVFRPRIVVYTRRFRIAPRLRVIRAHRFYRPNRAYCFNVVVRSNRVRVNRGYRPINRPRYNNGNRFNDRGRGFQGRPNTFSSDRNQVADRSRTERVRDNRPAGRTNNPRTSPQVRTNGQRQASREKTISDRRVRDQSRLPTTREPNRSVRRPVEQARTTERRTIDRYRSNSPSTRQPSARNRTVRESRPSRTSDFRQTKSRSSTQVRKAPSNRRISPSVSSNPGQSTKARVNSRSRTAPSRQVRPSSRSSSPKVRTAPRTSPNKKRVSSSNRRKNEL